MKKSFILLFSLALIFLLSLTVVSAQGTSSEMSSYKATFTLVGSTAIVEESITFASPQQNLSWPLPDDAEAVEITKNSHVPFTSLTFKYITESLVEKTKDRFFLIDLSKVTASEISVKVQLPEGATLKYSLENPEASLQTSLVPKTSKVSTDGKSIIILWDEQDLQQGKAIMVRYVEPQEFISARTLFILIFLLLIFFAGIFFSKKTKTS